MNAAPVGPLLVAFTHRLRVPRTLARVMATALACTAGLWSAEVAARCRSAEELAGFRPACFTQPPETPDRLPPGPRGLRTVGLEAVRGMTIGPIESTLQAGRGYGDPPMLQTLNEVQHLGANWVSLTVFGRAWDRHARGVELSFERPVDETEHNIAVSVRAAHERGLRVLLVPHLWVESGEWRAEIDPGDEQAWARWARSYRRFIVEWARVAERAEVDLFALGVELRSWVTTERVQSFLPLIGEVREVYSGPLTYAANWDDADDTMIWGQLDVLSLNAFYPLHWEDDANAEQLWAGGQRVAEGVAELAQRHQRPVLFSEFGYTTRRNTAIEPWLWPEVLSSSAYDEVAQAEAYAALLFSMLEVEGFAGLFVWRMYADLADASQEPEWGFSPYGKRAYPVLERAYRERSWGDPGLGLPRFP